MQGALDWLNIYPKGIEELLIYTTNKYRNSLIYITENGNYFLTLIISASHLYGAKYTSALEKFAFKTTWYALHCRHR